MIRQKTGKLHPLESPGAFSEEEVFRALRAHEGHMQVSDAKLRAYAKVILSGKLKDKSARRAMKRVWGEDPRILRAEAEKQAAAAEAKAEAKAAETKAGAERGEWVTTASGRRVKILKRGEDPYAAKPTPMAAKPTAGPKRETPEAVRARLLAEYGETRLARLLRSELGVKWDRNVDSIIRSIHSGDLDRHMPKLERVLRKKKRENNQR